MTKQEKKELKEILSLKEINRAQAKLLINSLFNGSYLALGDATNIPAMWLKEQISAIKIFSLDSQERILQASVKEFKNKKIVLTKN